VLARTTIERESRRPPLAAYCFRTPGSSALRRRVLVTESPFLSLALGAGARVPLCRFALDRCAVVRRSMNARTSRGSNQHRGRLCSQRIRLRIRAVSDQCPVVAATCRDCGCQSSRARPSCFLYVHKGYPISYRAQGGVPSIQISIALDRRHGDIDVDDRSSIFPASLLNGHLTSSNSDVRAGSNFDRLADRTAGDLQPVVSRGVGGSRVAGRSGPRRETSSRALTRPPRHLAAPVVCGGCGLSPRLSVRRNSR
jgi:hypothetical protein